MPFGGTRTHDPTILRSTDCQLSYYRSLTESRNSNIETVIHYCNYSNYSNYCRDPTVITAVMTALKAVADRINAWKDRRFFNISGTLYTPASFIRFKDTEELLRNRPQHQWSVKSCIHRWYCTGMF